MRWLCALLLVLGLSAPAIAAAPARHVLLISIDGLRPDALMQGATPAIKALMKEGSFSLSARTVFPSITLTSHVSMMTGVSPARHHVLWNEWEPARGPLTVRTMFDVARDAGFSTAMFAGKAKFKHFENGKRFDAFAVPAYEMTAVTDAAVSHILAHRPNLIMVHLAEPDGAGHAHGWMSREQFEAIARADVAVGRLLDALDEAGIASQTAVLLTADHGGHARTHGTASDVDMTIPWIAAGAGVRAAGALAQPIFTCDTAATAMALLGLKVPADWEGTPVAGALSATAQPRRATSR